MAIPNPAADEAPAGGEDDFVVLETSARPREFDFEPRDHIELGRMLGAIDIERGAKVSRARASTSSPASAPQLELALVNLAMEQARDGRLHPGDRALAGAPARDGGHRLPRPGRRRRLPDRGRGPLPGRHLRGADGGVPLRRDPRRRRAAAALRRASAPASAGRPARTARTPAASSGCTGSTRSRCSSTRPSRSPTPSTSGCWRWEKEFLDKLELAYRVIDVAAGDLGPERAPQVRLRGVDPHPGQVPRAHLDLQLHRLPGPPPRHPHPREGEQSQPVATLNGTLCAMTRTIVAILETHQQADGSSACRRRSSRGSAVTCSPRSTPAELVTARIAS